MTEISASLVKELREKSGAGMMDCKKALVECSGDFEQAVDWLRKKGLSAAAKKSGREAAEGLIALVTSNNESAIIELNSETDFVARNEKFQELARNIAKISLDKKIEDLDTLKNTSYDDKDSVLGAITNLVAIIGENMNLRRVALSSVEKGVVASYVHNAVSNGLGKIGVLVALESEANTEELNEFGKKIAMHIAASRPDYLNVESVDPAALQREKEIFAELSRNSGKPENIIDKMVEGRVKKYYQETVLLEQVFVMDNKTPIHQVVAEFAKQVGSPVAIKSFLRFELGEGIEKTKTDFAAEVASMSK